MRVHLQAPLHTSLQHLLPAFPLTVALVQGRAVVRRRGFERVLAPGQAVTMAPFELVDLHLDGSHAQPACCMVEIRDEATSASGESLHRRLTQRVFLEPHRPWSAALIAERLDMTTAQVRRLLFSQGTALTDVCRTQRLMRVLFDAMAGDLDAAEIRRRTGWPAGGDLEAAFHDRFGLTLQAARRLAMPVASSPVMPVAPAPVRQASTPARQASTPVRQA